MSTVATRNSSLQSRAGGVPRSQRKPYKCSKCERAFNTLAKLERHGRRAHAGERRHSCSGCQQSFADPAELSTHQRHAHGIHRPHKCPLCAKTFALLSSLRVHKRTHMGGQSFLPGSSLQQSKIPSGRDYKCLTCGKDFSKPYHLRRHQEVHLTALTHKCPDCGKCFRAKTHLYLHRLVHGTKHKCDQCNKVFVHEAGLQGHLQRFHSRPGGEEEEAGGGGGQAQPLPPEPLNWCSQCPKRFRSAARLAIHRRRFHARQEEKEEAAATPESKALACTLCDRVFRHSSTLSHHKSRHLSQELRCSVCTHDLANSGSLQLRVRLHHTGGKRPYHCLVCSRTFCAMLTFLRHCEKHQQQDKEGQGARSAK
ncbi:UNVERIFIED_CONTAM: hypothetical protein FKN15_034715 [Acipenser sinensis]